MPSYLILSVASVTSVTNDKGDNEMIMGAVHKSPGICITAEENPRKSQLGDCLKKRLCDQSNGVPFLPSSIQATCSAHLNVLDLIALTILGGRYKL